MHPDLEAIKDAWDKNTGKGREEKATRELCDAYVKAHPEQFTELERLSLEECVTSLSVFRAAGMVESQWRVEAWLLHRFEPQQIGGEAKVIIRMPSPGGN